MAHSRYSDFLINLDVAGSFSKKYFGITGTVKELPGELDFNFKIATKEGYSYILKVSRPGTDESDIDLQQKILQHLLTIETKLKIPKIIPTKENKTFCTCIDEHGQQRILRMLAWIDGRIWSSVCPVNNELLYSLGKSCGQITKAFQSFSHPRAEKNFDWNLDHVIWVENFLHLFPSDKMELISVFLKKYTNEKHKIENLRKSIIHNDANDNNIIVNSSLYHAEVIAIIDFGDAVFSSCINDVAVAIAYAVMGKPDPLAAATYVVKGYHEQFALKENELELLYLLVAMRLIISLTKSAINKISEPENDYLLISEEAAWVLLQKWFDINENLACYTFRQICGLSPHPDQYFFESWARDHSFGADDIFPSLGYSTLGKIDMSIGSTWLGHPTDFNNNDWMNYKIKEWTKEHPGTMPANGYLEIRPFYSTDAYRKEGNNGPEYRTVHLGIDFWIENGTPIHAPFDGKIISVYNNNFIKDYGPTIIIQHEYGENRTFYTLYGHLAKSSLKIVTEGQLIQKGQLIGYIGQSDENGNWAPHLHFQIILDMLGNVHDFQGVCFPMEVDVWKSICPDPNLFLKQKELTNEIKNTENTHFEFRSAHLGKSLSLSYDAPLRIERGDGIFLIDHTGRKYVDTVNNVAHVGHEHPGVVKAGQQQMAILNTNTRYLHNNIVELAEILLSTFPPALSVVHFVNSGSEANELALRMAYNYTGQKDIIAMESGYHGNTNACIGISAYKFNGKGGHGKPDATHLVPLPDTFRGIYQGDGCGLKYARHVGQIIENVQSQNKKIAAFIHESVVSCGGQIELPQGFLKNSYDQVKRTGGLCIADEVQTGCGRIGTHWWAFQQHEVVPDIVTIGKPLGNGHPIAAVICTKEVAESFANGMEFFNTFGGNPVSCAIGLEVMNVIKEEGLMNKAVKTGQYLKQRFEELKTDFPIMADIRGKGLFLGFELTDEKFRPLPKQTHYLVNRMKEFGILMSSDGPDQNVIKIKPPMVFDINHADELTSRLRQVFKEDAMNEI